MLRADDGDGDGDEDLDADMAMEFAEHAELSADGRRIGGGVGMSDDEDGGPANDDGGGSEDEDGDDLDGGSEGIDFDVRILWAACVVSVLQTALAVVLQFWCEFCQTQESVFWLSSAVIAAWSAACPGAASVLVVAAQAGGDDEDGWEDGGDLDDDEGDGEGEGTGTPRWLPRANGAPHDPSQPVMIGGNHYLVGGTAEMQARAQNLAPA